VCPNSCQDGFFTSKIEGAPEGEYGCTQLAGILAMTKEYIYIKKINKTRGRWLTFIEEEA